MREVKTGPTQFRVSLFSFLFLWIKLCLLETPNLWADENVSLSRWDTPHLSICATQKYWTYTVIKLGEEQLLSPGVAAILVFLFQSTEVKGLPTLSVPVGFPRSAPLAADYISYPPAIWGSSCHWPLSLHPQVGKQILPQVPALLPPPSNCFPTSLQQTMYFP